MNSLLSFISQNPELNLVSDSRAVNEQSLFFAIVGSQSDGHDYLEQVTQKKAAGLVLQTGHPSIEGKALQEYSGQIFYLPNTRKAWAEAWKIKSGSIDEKLFILGVTGTNGKTSMVNMAEHILNSADQACAVMGTINHHLLNKVWPTTMTTPGSEILYPRLQEFYAEGAKACAMEISSHGLDQRRTEGLNINAAIFSNLTNDHLDYHKDLDEYFLAKEKLFTQLLAPSNKKNKVAVINLMDAWGSKVIINKKYKTYYLYEKDLNAEAHERRMSFIAAQKKKYNVVSCEIEIVKSDQYGSRMIVTIEEDAPLKGAKNQAAKIGFNLPIVGKFQAMNWAQVALALRDHVNNDAVLQSAAQTFAGIPGRLQKVQSRSHKNIFVDYAHTPDALQRSLESLRQITKGQVVVIFGCGGDRDKAKRPEMAQVAERLADHVIVTNDNPRTESPEAIAEEILQGFEEMKPKVLLDRKAAIEAGVASIESADDVLLIAGKGHEDYQIFGNERVHFSDYETAFEILQREGQ